MFVHGTLLRKPLTSALVGSRIAAAEIGDQRVDDRLGAPWAVTPREGPEQMMGNGGPVVLLEPRFAEGFKATEEPCRSGVGHPRSRGRTLGPLRLGTFCRGLAAKHRGQTNAQSLIRGRREPRQLVEHAEGEPSIPIHRPRGPNILGQDPIEPDQVLDVVGAPPDRLGDLGRRGPPPSVEAPTQLEQVPAGLEGLRILPLEVLHQPDQIRVFGLHPLG